MQPARPGQELQPWIGRPATPAHSPAFQRPAFQRRVSRQALPRQAYPPDPRQTAASAGVRAGSSVVVVVSDDSADSLLPSSRLVTVSPAPADNAAPAKKSVVNARLAAIFRGATRTFFLRARVVMTSRLRSRRTTALRSDSAAARKSVWTRPFLPGFLRCGIALLRFVRAPRPPLRRGSHDDVRGRNGIETTIGVRRHVHSLDLRNRRTNPQIEGLPGDPSGAMNGIELSP